MQISCHAMRFNLVIEIESKDVLWCRNQLLTYEFPGHVETTCSSALLFAQSANHDFPTIQKNLIDPFAQVPLANFAP
jgi:hypothetical protein